MAQGASGVSRPKSQASIAILEGPSWEFPGMSTPEKVWHNPFVVGHTTQSRPASAARVRPSGAQFTSRSRPSSASRLVSGASRCVSTHQVHYEAPMVQQEDWPLERTKVVKYSDAMVIQMIAQSINELSCNVTNTPQSLTCTAIRPSPPAMITRAPVKHQTLLSSPTKSKNIDSNHCISTAQLGWAEMWALEPTRAINSCKQQVTLIQSVFSRRPFVLFFGYHPKCGAGERCANRACRTVDFGAGSISPPKMFFCHTSTVHEYHAVLNTIQFGGLHRTSKSSMKWSLLWGGCPSPDLLRCFQPFQKTNHFPSSWQLGRKDYMWRNIRAMQRQWPQEFDITPASYVFPEDRHLWAGARLEQPKAWWIWKPVNSSCGRGIRLLKSDLGYATEKRLCRRPGIVQRYIKRPLLVNGRKFDLRLYVVVTSFDPLKIYLNSEGLVRIATKKYSKLSSTMQHRTMHLTNYSVNKHAKAYVKNLDASTEPGSSSDECGSDDMNRNGDADGSCFDAEAHSSCDEEGGMEYEDPDDIRSFSDTGNFASNGMCQSSKWSLQELREFFKTEGLDYELMMLRIEDLIIKTLIAVEPVIVSAWHEGANFAGSSSAQPLRGVGPNQTCFEIYGFDVIIDQALEPWLLEVNTCPSFSSSSPLDKRIKTKLIADVLTLVGLRPFKHELIEAAMEHERENQVLGRQSNLQNRAKSYNIRSLAECRLLDFGEAEWTTILDTHDEFMRRGSLERIFPTAETVDRYQKFFQTQRYANVVLAKWLREGGASCFSEKAGRLRPSWVPAQSFKDPC